LKLNNRTAEQDERSYKIGKLLTVTAALQLITAPVSSLAAALHHCSFA